MHTAALIVAAGRGTRAIGVGDQPKQYVSLGGRPVLAHSVQAFVDHPAVDHVRVVIHPGDRSLYDDAVSRINDPKNKLHPPVDGGPTRQASVRNGLKALAAQDNVRVLIHDAARPFVSPKTITNVVAALDGDPAAIAATPLADTLKRADHAGTIVETIPRQSLWRAQTPQGFHLAPILKAHNQAAEQADGKEFTDDAAVAEWAGIRTKLVETSEQNEKLTTAKDIELAQSLLSPSVLRTGSGYDVHKFGPGDTLWLCGIEIPFEQTLVGHSDADVGLHALTDAILGAIAAGDIGSHFPPSDPKWKGASSDVFLRHAAALIEAQHATISNVDVTLICEHPKITPHRDAMQRRIAEILDVDLTCVSVKATTTEGLGFTGRGEGIAAMAQATICTPNSTIPS